MELPMNKPTTIQPNSKSMTKEEFEGCKLTFGSEALIEAIGLSLSSQGNGMMDMVCKLINTVEHGFKEESE